MNKDQVRGRVDQAVGKVKEVAGETANNKRLEGKSLADQGKGKLQSSYSAAKESFKDQVKPVIDKI